MTRLVWNQQGQNRYEFGVDQGVFYDSDNLGVVWNGLASVIETSVGGGSDSYHYDGVKYLDTVAPRTYQATISAFSSPQQFSVAVGNHPVIPGFVLTRQTRSRFGLSYRTFIGPDLGYKIHIVYNALASPTQRGFSTTDNSGDPNVRAWRIDAVPPVYGNYRPSAHYILDSSRMSSEIMEILEDIIYGSETTPPRLPSPGEIIDIVKGLDTLYIVGQPLTGLAELVPGMGDLYRSDIDGLQRILPDSKLYPSHINGLYRLE